MTRTARKIGQILTLVTTTILCTAQLAPAQEILKLDRDTLQAEIRNYILTNPEIIREALVVLEQKRVMEEAQAEEMMVENNAKTIFDDGFSFAGGNPDGSITVVEFQDYRCGYCKRAHGDVKELVANDGDIRLIVKEFPILGEDSLTTSRIAIATMLTQGPEAYYKISDAMMSYSGPINDKAIDRLAKSAGIDIALVRSRLNDPEIDKRIGITHALGRDLEISGTPTFIIGGKLIRGYIPLEDMKEVVQLARNTQD